MCIDYINSHGYGNCKKEFYGKVVCYVSIPSSCSDVQESANAPGKLFSFEACSRNGEYFCLQQCNSSHIISLTSFYHFVNF